MLPIYIIYPGTTNIQPTYIYPGIRNHTFSAQLEYTHTLKHIYSQYSWNICSLFCFYTKSIPLMRKAELLVVDIDLHTSPHISHLTTYTTTHHHTTTHYANMANVIT